MTVTIIIMMASTHATQSLTAQRLRRLYIALLSTMNEIDVATEIAREKNESSVGVVRARPIGKSTAITEKLECVACSTHSMVDACKLHIVNSRCQWTRHKHHCHLKVKCLTRKRFAIRPSSLANVCDSIFTVYVHSNRCCCSFIHFPHIYFLYTFVS